MYWWLRPKADAVSVVLYCDTMDISLTLYTDCEHYTLLAHLLWALHCTITLYTDCEPNTPCYTARSQSEKFSNAAVDANKASPLLNAQGVPMERDPSAAIIDDDFGPIPTSDDATRARNQIQAVRVVGPVSQGDFLLGMGIRERLEMLMDRYVGRE